MEKIIAREGEMEILRCGKGMTDVAKVITGMRRVGKSTLLRMFIDELRESGVPEEDIVWMDFDSFDYIDICKSNDLNPILIEKIGNGMKYVFLDEIQNVEGWERSVSALIATRRCDIYITGSNSKLLSSELATHIAGRYIEIPLLPLSFKEYLTLYPGDEKIMFDNYLKYGALPEVDPSRGDRFCKRLLTDIYNSILIKDVLTRVRRGDVITINSISRFLYSNVGKETNIDNISSILNISKDTVKKYVHALKEAFLFYQAERYDVVGKKILRTKGKFYASDLGLRNIAFHDSDMDFSRPLENVVYLELLRRGYTVRVGSFKEYVIDFTAHRDGRVEYYQVCQSMMDEATRERETRSLKDLTGYYGKKILTCDTMGLGAENGIEAVNVIDWLLGRV